MHKKQGLLIIIIGLALSGCGHESYDFSPYDNRYSDTEMLYESRYIARDSGETIPYIPPRVTPTIMGNSVSTSSVPENVHEVQVSIPQGDDVWISQQASTAYTIELVDDISPTLIANQFLQTPQSEHHAQFRYLKNGTTHYKGIYGSFNTEEDAQAAMQALPAQLKSQARIIQFGRL